MNKLKLKIGIIGFGKMGQIRARAIEEDSRGQVKSIFEPNIEPDSFEYKLESDADTLFNDGEIDCVFICTPNYLVQPLTIQALRAGKHVFCEKPPAFSAAELESVIKVEKESGKKLMYGFNHRHHGSILKISSLINSGEFGNLLWMRGRYGKSVDSDFFNTWRAKRETAGGGILLDQGIHMLDLFLLFTGDFDIVKSEVSNLYWQQDIEDNVFAIYKNSSSGVVASLHSTMTQWRHLFSLELFLEKGYMVLNGLKTSSGTYGDEVLSVAKNRTTAPAATWEDEEHIRYHIDNSWRSEVIDFFSAIKHNRTVKNGNSSDALKLMKIIDKIYSFRKKG